MSHATLQIKQPLKHQNVVDRRAAPRFDASAIPGFKSINQVGGPEVKLINISRGGALIESHELMPPGTIISLRIVTAEMAHIIRGQIVRCRTSSMSDIAPQYHSSIAFDEDFTILPASAD